MTEIFGELSPLLAAVRPPLPDISWEGFGDFLRGGAPYTWVNLGVAGLALALGLERAISFRLRFHLDAEPFIERIERLLRVGNRERAAQLCGSVRGAPLAIVLAAALKESTPAGLTVSDGLSEPAPPVNLALAEQRARVESRNGWMISLAHAATLVGLVGTAVGICETFQSLGDVTPEEKGVLFGRGLSRAMNNAALGLGLAALCVVAHAGLAHHSSRMVRALEAQVGRLTAMLQDPR